MLLVGSAPHTRVDLTERGDPPQQRLAAFRRECADGPRCPLDEGSSGSRPTGAGQVEQEYAARHQRGEDARKYAAEGGGVVRGRIVEHLADRGGGDRARQGHIEDRAALEVGVRQSRASERDQCG